MSNAILYRMPFGVQGDITRPSQSTNEAQILSASLPFSVFGLPGKIASGLFVPIATSADIVYGFLARTYPTQGPNASDPLGTSVPAIPPSGGAATCMVRGYINAVCNAGTPTLGGAVYVRYANGSAGTPIGGLEATAVAGSNFVIPLARFMCGADSNNITEVAFNV